MSADPVATPAPEPRKKGGALKWVLIAVVLLLVMGGGGGGYWYFVMRPQAAAATDPAAAEQEAASKKGHGNGGAALKFDPFVVNLADPGGVRYLRLGLSLVIDGTEDEAKHLEETKVQLLRIRSAVLDLLSQQLSEQVVTPEGKQVLKHAIQEQAGAVLEPLEVTDVLFTEFVVQF
jgi:flagellar FliL protein